MDKHPVSYTLIRSKRKTLALQVRKNEGVCVRAPLRLPKRDIDAFVARHSEWIETQLQNLSQARPEPSQEELAMLKARAQSELPPRVAQYAAQMGLYPSGVRITSARTRFGSCSGKNSLCFSCRLLLYDDRAIDYVIVHELSHILHKNHSAAFYALIAAVMPDYKARRALLKG